MPPEGNRNRAVDAAWVALLLAASATLYWGVVPKLLRDLWEDPNYSHGLLVPFFSAYLAWHLRERLSLFPEGRTSLKGLFLIVAAATLLIVGKAAGELFTMRISLVLMVAGLAGLLLGADGFRRCRFPLAFLVFMVPIPYIAYDAASLPLKLVSSRIAEEMMTTVGIPVLREGNLITLPHMRMEVVDACSGIRSLMSLLAIGTVAGYYAQLRLGWMLLLLGTVVPVTVILNSLRLFLTGLLSIRVGPRAAEGFLHEFSGWVTFMVGAVIVAVFAFLIMKISRRKGDVISEERAEDSP